MASALLRLREHAKQLSSTERNIAAKILDNPQLVIDLNIHELARRTAASASSIVRLCNHAGFSGYKEFRRSVTYELTVRQQSTHVVQTEILDSDCTQDVVDKVAYANIVALQETRELLDVSILDVCADNIRKARTIYLFGVGSSLHIARIACLRLLDLGLPAAVGNDLQAQYLYSRIATEGDIAIVFSSSGTTPEILECVNALKDRDLSVVAVTRCVGSPVADLADHVLFTTSAEHTGHSDSFSSSISQLCVVDVLCTILEKNR